MHPLVQRLRNLRDEWHKLYRYHGGAWTELRCLLGTLAVRQGWVRSDPLSAEVEALTFSVVPKMTAVWARFMLNVAARTPLHIVIGDSAGTLSRVLPVHSSLRILPVFNDPHGVKLDLFVHHVCRAKYLIVTDDDIFWLGDTGLRWALAQFEQNPKLAIVSLLPFPLTPEMAARKQPPPMGSCFIIRRDLWVREKVSFEVDRAPLARGENWIYDTGAKAQIQLMERGYEVRYLPEDMRGEFVALEGMSTWTLKNQKHRGDLQKSIEKHVGLQDKIQQKALRMAVAARRLAGLFGRLYPGHASNDLIDPAVIERSVTHIRAELTHEQAAEAEQEINHLMDRLDSALSGSGRDA